MTTYRMNSRAKESLLPLTDLPLPSKKRKSIVVGVGPAGRRLAEGNTVAACIVVDEQADEDSWRTAFSRASERPGANYLLEGAACIPIILVGSGADVRAAWSTLRQRFQLADVKTGIVVLELGTTLSDQVPVEFDIWFQLSPHFADGELDAEHLSALAGLLIERQVMTSLLGIAARMQVTSPVRVTVTLAWVPEVSVRQVVACQLRIKVRRSLLQGRITARRHHPLVPASSLAPLTGRLRKQLSSEVSKTMTRVRQGRAAAVFESTAHAAEAESLTTVEQWCEQQWQFVLGMLAGIWREDPSELSSVRAQIMASLASLQQGLRAASDRERREKVKLEPIVRLGKAADSRRIESRRPIGFLLNWWRSWRVLRLFKRYSLFRSEQLLARYEFFALQQMSHKLELLDTRLDAFLAESESDEQLLRSMLEPRHPCLFAVHDLQSLTLVAEHLTERLEWSLPRSGDRVVWRQAISDVVADLGAGEEPWRHVARAARATAGGLPTAGDTFAKACRALAPRYRPQRLRDLMLRSAWPGCAGPAVERCYAPVVLHASQDGDGQSNPRIALWLQWETSKAKQPSDTPPECGERNAGSPSRSPAQARMKVVRD